MIELILAILLFNVILIIFKLFEKYKVDNLQAITVNYISASALGFMYATFRGTEISAAGIFQSNWFPLALAIGFFFIVVFNMLATGAQKVGMAVSSIANKMSMVIPVVFSILVFGDSIGTLKIIGLIAALIGVYLSSTDGSKLSFDKKYLWLIILIFLGQGTADCIFAYADRFYVSDEQNIVFISTMFGAALCTGILLLIQRIIKGKLKFQLKNIVWGFILSVPNLGTVFFFLEALDSGFMEASQVYPIMNMGIIINSALIGFLAFKEKLSLINWIGILVSAAAIAAVSFG